MHVKSYTQNRELSWLKFNERVLEEASDLSVPLLERLKFVSIFTSNLDEFFMIRVGGLFDLSSLSDEHRDNKSGMTASEQLDRIYEALRPIYAAKAKIYGEIKAGLKNHGIFPLDFSELNQEEISFIKLYYRENIKPILSPQIVDTHHPFPHILNKEIYITALLKHKSSPILGLLPVPNTLPELIFLPAGNDEVRYIRTENVLFEFADDVFGKYEILEKNCMCVTRNADINPDDESFEVIDDFRIRMKKLLHKRKRLAVVRLEVNYELSSQFEKMLCDRFDIDTHQIFLSGTALKMGYVFSLFDKIPSDKAKQLTYPPFSPAKSAQIDTEQSIIKQIKQKDLLLFYPFESMDVFLQLIKEASRKPNVISIKITIYRLAKKAKLVDYLCEAAENGKDVTVIMELRARFDEQNNIDWSEELEDAGCKIIYGFDKYKVHSKVCLITMKEKSGISYITQIGTGNYNEKTAELYTDLSLITANTAIGNDATDFFKNMLIGSIEGDYRLLLAAPTNLKPTLIYMMDKEIEKGADGVIIIKINSITDIDFINKLAEASRAGVKVRLIVRGICCILPQLPGETDNIKVISIVGRFLEHSRIYSFGRGDSQKIYISSADLMTRNTERRIEIACPILDQSVKTRINNILETLWYDNEKARILLPNGSYTRKVDNRTPLDAQAHFIEEYTKAAQFPVKSKKQLFKRLKTFFSGLFKKTN